MYRLVLASLVAVGTVARPAPALDGGGAAQDAPVRDAGATTHRLALERMGEAVVDPSALTIDGGFGRAIHGKSFQQDMLLSHGDHQYVGYYDGAGRVCLGRRALPDGEWEVLRFSDYTFTSDDAHNTISIGICARDGTLHLAFDHHVHPLHYRVSRPGLLQRPEELSWEPELFGPIRSELEEGKPIRITYPRFVSTPDGGLQFCYRRGRSGGGDRMLVDYDTGEGRWTGTRQIDSGAGTFADSLGESTSRCSYPNGYTYGPLGRLHATWVWRESSQGANHDLAYAYSEDRGLTWKTGDGVALDTPPSVSTPRLVAVPLPRTLGLMNTHGQAVDSEGRVHVVMWHCTPESLAAVGSEPGAERWGPAEARRYHHYWRDAAGRWHHHELPWVAGSRPKLFLGERNDAWLIHRGSTQYVREGPLVIATATAASGWTDWRIVHEEEGPFLGEMLGDPHRWSSEGVLSVVVQDVPRAVREPSALRVIDFRPGVDGR